MNDRDKQALEFIVSQYGAWLDAEEYTPWRNGDTFIAWDVQLGFLTLARWHEGDQAYIETGFDEKVQPTFWMPVFAPDSPVFNEKFVLKEVPEHIKNQGRIHFVK